MYRIQTGYQLATVDQNCCRITDHTDQLELTARQGQLGLLVHRLTNGFSRRGLYELLDDGAHPLWSRAALWDRLGGCLSPVAESPEPKTQLRSLADTNLVHLSCLDAAQLWARQQQVVHLNRLDELGQQVAIMLARQGWQAFISHDRQHITAQDTGLLFTSAHIDAQRTVVCAPILRRINPWLNLVSAQALDSTELAQNHQVLWFADEPEQLLNLGTHSAAQLSTLPIYLGASGISIGPWLAPDQHCLACLVQLLSDVTGGAPREQPSVFGPVQHSLVAIGAYTLLAKRALQWSNNQAPPGLPTATDAEPSLGSPTSGTASFLVVGANATNLAQIQVSDSLTECTH